MSNDAPEISYVDRQAAGSCNFCTRSHRKVYSIKAAAPMSSTVRICAKCRKELNRLP